MLRTSNSRIAVTTVLTLAGFLGTRAQAQAPGPHVVFSAGSGTVTVSKATTPVLPIKVVATDPAGVTAITLSSRAGIGTGFFPASTTGTLCITFYDSYYRNGNYKFTALVTNAKGVTTTEVLTVHLTN